MKDRINKLNLITHPIEDTLFYEGKRIVLITFSNKNEDEKNIYHLDEDNNIIWRVWSSLKLEGGFFTKVWEQDGALLCSNYDGFIRQIDVETGEATPQKYLK